MEQQEYWKTKLNAFDAQLCKMVESLTEMECEPKNGGDHYFIECNYRKHNDPDFIMALWDALEGRAGDRLMEIKDDPERTSLFVRIRFYSGQCKNAAFVPKIEQE